MEANYDPMLEPFALALELPTELFAQAETPDSVTDMEMPVVQVYNVVSSIYLGHTMEIKLMGAEIVEAKYDAKRIDAAQMSLRDPQSEALVYANGTMICYGAKSEWQAQLAALRHVRTIQRYNFTAKCLDFKIESVTGTCQLPFSIQLDNLSKAYPDVISYEPEVHPALVYYMADPKVSFTIYKTGKVFINDAKEEQDLHKAFESIYPILKNYRIP
ncbi:transcription factor TFIID [Trichuris suis]|nr:transcription factor TFIID [Trichuris suis]